MPNTYPKRKRLYRCWLCGEKAEYHDAARVPTRER